MKFTTKEQELLTKIFYRYNFEFKSKKYKKKLEEKHIKQKYKNDMSWCIKHITYYDFLNKKMNRKNKTNHNLLKTIKTYDYMSPVAY